ncbi:MAG: RraA family protein [Chloroflexi bacterium]|nr:RraA family protein [Chloroflexota bacterium]
MTNLWNSDEELFSLMKTELFTAVVGDVLDKMGLLHQFLPPRIQALHPDMLVAGRAMPVLEADYYVEKIEGQTELSSKPFGLMFHALDDLKPNEVYIAAGTSQPYAMWGELMSTRAIHLKAAGAVVDGYSRDTKGILRLNFPTFSHGRYAQDQGARGKVIDWRVPIEIGKIRIQPGDIVFGDIDGVLIVPKAAEEEAINRALEKVRAENMVRKAIEDGMSTVEAFETYGVM